MHLPGASVESGETTSILWLWFLGLAWGLGPWLALALAAVVATTAIRALHRFARQIEARPVRPGFRGFVAIFRDLVLHRAVLKGVLLTLIAGVLLTGLLTAGIQGIVQRRVAGMIEEEAVVAPEPPAVSDEGAVLDWIVLAGLISVGVAAVGGIRVCRALRRRALAFLSGPSVSEAQRPLVVRLFHDNRPIGIILVVAGGWIFCAVLTQLAGLLLLMVPAVTAKPIPGVMTAAIVLLVLLGLLLYGALLTPLAWFSWRNLRLQIRAVRGNAVARGIFQAQAVLWGGLLGLILNLYLVALLGRRVWPAVFS